MKLKVTAAEPRRLSFAPNIEERYKRQVEKIEGRQELLKHMNKDSSSCIGFDSFFTYMYTHICEKVRGIDAKDKTVQGLPVLFRARAG